MKRPRGERGGKKAKRQKELREKVEAGEVIPKRNFPERPNFGSQRPRAAEKTEEEPKEVEVVDKELPEPARDAVRTGDFSGVSASSSSRLTQPIGSSEDFRPGAFSAVTSTSVVVEDLEVRAALDFHNVLGVSDLQTLHRTTKSSRKPLRRSLDFCCAI